MTHFGGGAEWFLTKEKNAGECKPTYHHNPKNQSREEGETDYHAWFCLVPLRPTSFSISFCMIIFAPRAGQESVILVVPGPVWLCVVYCLFVTASLITLCNSTSVDSS